MCITNRGRSPGFARWFSPCCSEQQDLWTGSVAQVEAARERRRCFGRRSGKEWIRLHLHGKAVVTRSVSRFGTRDDCRRRKSRRGMSQDDSRQQRDVASDWRTRWFARATSVWSHARVSRGTLACGDVMTVNRTRLSRVHRKSVLYLRRCHGLAMYGQNWQCLRAISCGVRFAYLCN